MELGAEDLVGFKLAVGFRSPTSSDSELSDHGLYENR